jgi:hypothetical protein
MCGACSAYGGKQQCIQDFDRKLETEDTTPNPDIEGRIVLMWILKCCSIVRYVNVSLLMCNMCNGLAVTLAYEQLPDLSLLLLLLLLALNYNKA